ncbi:MAG: transposase [Alphaproteobacteria bacterium]|nr:transposase [Alphaproteobacteria bacterium]
MSIIGHAGWRSRGYLPHCDNAGLVQHVVFGLHDALPAHVPFESDDQLDEGHGACLLRDGDCADIVERVLLKADASQYRLVAWCVMPNHVHVVFEQMAGRLLGRAVQELKSVSAHRINKQLSRKGAVWRREYFDRYMRDGDHLVQTVRYVEANPVKAGLVENVMDWPFSSGSYSARKLGD